MVMILILTCQSYLSHTFDQESVWMHENTWRGQVDLCWSGSALEMFSNPKHTSKKAASLFQTNRIIIMKTQSSGLMKQKTDRRESICLFLGNAVQLFWAGIHGYKCQNLFESRQCRCGAETVLQLNISSQIHNILKSFSIFQFLQ